MLKEQKKDFGFQAYVAPHPRPVDGTYNPYAMERLSKVGRRVMRLAKLPEELRKKLFCEAFRDAVQKDGILYTRGREMGPPYNIFFGKHSPYLNDLHPFGEIGICYIPSLAYKKTDNKGRVGIYLNLPINHPRHTYKFYNPHTNSVFTSRNVTWTGLMWGDYEKNNPKVLDSEYDNLKAEILNLEKEYNFLKSNKSPSINVGFKPSKNFQKEQHKVPMLSLANAFSEEDLEN